MAAWKKHYRPILIGKKLLILPAWIEREDPGRVAVKIDPSAWPLAPAPTPPPSSAWRWWRIIPSPGINVIDVGCGSGILSMAALKLGAGHALGVDIDNAAVISSKENAEANGVLDRLEVGIGSVTELLEGKFSLRQAPLVLANILAPVIIRLFDAGLADLVEPGGILILSGILDTQAPDVQAGSRSQRSEVFAHPPAGRLGGHRAGKIGFVMTSNIQGRTTGWCPSL